MWTIAEQPASRAAFPIVSAARAWMLEALVASLEENASQIHDEARARNSSGDVVSLSHVTSPNLNLSDVAHRREWFAWLGRRTTARMR